MNLRNKGTLRDSAGKCYASAMGEEKFRYREVLMEVYN